MKVVFLLLSYLTISSLSNLYAWNGSAADSYAGGNGTKANPYQIATAEQLTKLASDVNGGVSTKQIYYQLTDDIVLNTQVLKSNGTLNTGSFYAWPGIGRYVSNNGIAFQGIFDGNGHTISGLYASNTSSASYLSLFAYINEAEIKNLGVIDSYFYGNSNSAGVVAKANNSKIINCYSKAWVGGNGSYHGGIVSWATGTTSVVNCYNAGIVNGKNNCAGIVSRLGMSGSNACIVENSYNVGDISITKNYKAGIVAENNAGCNVRNCYFLNTLSEGVYLGSGTKDNVLAKTADEMKSSDVLTALNNASLFIPGACRWKAGSTSPILDYSTFTSDEKVPEKIEVSGPIPAQDSKFEEPSLDSLILAWKTSDKKRVMAHYLYISSIKNGLETDTAKSYARMAPADTFCMVKGLLSSDNWYWRVDECDTNGIITPGSEWHFRIVRPDPADIGFVRPLVNGLIGWGTYNDPDDAIEGITGGGNGNIVRVATRSDLEKYAKASEPYTILITESITGGGSISVTSNKTLIGVGRHVLFDNVGIDVSDRENIIIRNLTITKGTPDAIAFRNCRHVWVDHCDLSNSNDGLLDFTMGSNYLTVSYTKLHNHDKVSICNSGTGHWEDAGKNKVTYHHNWFDANVQRNPRVGYGMGHVFNNYYTNISSYCVGYFTGAEVLVENNYFYKSNTPLHQMYSSVPTSPSYGRAEERGNIFDITSGNTEGTGEVYDPEYYYDYTFLLNQAKEVPDMAKWLYGPISGVENEYYPIPGNGVIDVHATTLTWTNIENVKSWKVYFGTDTAEMEATTLTTRSFRPKELLPETVYYWRVDAVCQDTTFEGGLWHFRTAPFAASKPYPLNGELHANLREATSRTECTPLKLTWRKALYATKYRVYFDTVPNLSSASYRTETTSPAFAPGALKYGQTYYWRVDAVDAYGKEIMGDTWHFTSDLCYSVEGKTELEKMVRNGRVWIENQDDNLYTASDSKVIVGEGGAGSVSSVWNGSNATYSVSVNYFDERDGNASYSFYVNENKIQSWVASENTDKIITHTINGVKINKGDELRIAFYTNGGENCRTDVMTINVESLEMSRPNENLYKPYQVLKIKVYAMSGKIVRTYRVHADEYGHLPSLDIENQGLPQGIYFYHILGQGIPYRKAEIYMTD